MSGRSILLLIMGFVTIFSVVGYKLNTVSVSAVENMVIYYENTVAKNIAVTGANIGANCLFLDETWTGEISSSSTFGGTMEVTLETIDEFTGIKLIRSVGRFNKVTKEVRITVKPSKFSKFAYFCQNEPSNIWWTTGDTVWGPLHVQNSLKINGDPVFMGKATLKGNLVMDKNKSHPEFNGGLETGVDLEIPQNGIDKLKERADDGGFIISGHNVVYVQFENKKIKYRFSKNSAWIVETIEDLAPNGIIFVDGGDIRLEGKLDGRVTLVSSRDDKHSQGGTVWLDDDIVYKDDPLKKPGSDDLLGICAEVNTLITDNNSNKNDIQIHAAIYCETGGFGAENYSDRPPSGNIYLVGGITQMIRKAVGMFNSDHVIVRGFSKRYKYDQRLMKSSPPAFPGTGGFEIVSWYQ
jgi:hypothetical protein